MWTFAKKFKKNHIYVYSKATSTYEIGPCGIYILNTGLHPIA